MPQNRYFVIDFSFFRHFRLFLFIRFSVSRDAFFMITRISKMSRTLANEPEAMNYSRVGRY